MDELLTWLNEQAGKGHTTDELWTLLEYRLGGDRAATNRAWRIWVTKPY